MYLEEREQVALSNHGQKIFGIFHRPAGLAHFPAVLICHGLAGNKIGRYRLYVNLSEELAKVGIGSLRIDFRGSGDSEGEFSQTTLEGEYSDALVALKYLQHHPHVERQKMGIMGRSFGGLIAVMAASALASIKSLCLWAPVFNSHQWHTQLKEGGSTMVNGQFPGKEFFKQFFALQVEDYLKEIREKPLFLIHGSQDPIVHFMHSDLYAQSRLSASGLTRMIQLQHSDHDFTHYEERMQAMHDTVHWFTETLQVGN